MTTRFELTAELPGAEPFRLERWRCVDTGARVLVKIAPGAAPPAAIESLRREAQILEQLAVEGVPRLNRAGIGDDGRLAMDDPEGMPLALLAAQREIGLALAIGIQIAAILSEIHRRGLIHGALRPAAVLWDAACARAALVDFSEAVGGGAAPLAGAPQLALERLLYISPEQTGRMSRSIDQRSDLYSLGVMLYELLSGAPPFVSGDALELIHWHIARTPAAPADIDPGIPQPVSDVVMKLLAKMPEDRYRSAAGLRKDLERCLRDWEARGSIARFPLATHDLGEHFIVSNRLYGRRTEVAALLGAFDRVSQGAGPALLVVAGYSGIGKTALVQELYKPIVRHRGYFISGKFDQVVRSVPFGALIQAVRGLVRQLLTEREARLGQRRSALIQALGANGGVLAEVIPEIELIIGKQPPTTVLGPAEAANRFQLVFHNFFAALARPDHPLVVFLDDLQWADAATLRLFEPLLASREIPSLLLLAAYRDNEVDAAHPLARTLDALDTAGVEVQRLALGPLRLPDLTQLVADTLHGGEEHAAPLAKLLLEKTGGNPFFVTQFLTALKEDGHLEFDPARGRWAYGIEAIARAPMTDNVIDLMTRKILKLPERTQRALTRAACIGNPFDQQTLAIVSEQSPQQTADDLKQALSEGLVLPVQRGYDNADSGGTAGILYRFLHDRVQQSAYALIPEEHRQGVHLAVGRLLRSRTAPEELDERIFDVVHHLNCGRALLTDPAEQLDLARLDLSAGRKAKSSTAHEAALGLFRAGLGLLTQSHWESAYELAFALHQEAAESEYLCGRFDASEQRFAVLLRNAATSLDKANVHRLESLQYEHMARYADALISARRGLALCGVVFPDAAEEKEAALENAIRTIRAVLGNRTIASLVDLPAMTDPDMRMVMKIMADIWSSVYLLGDPVLARLISATMVRLSLKFGNAEESAYGYVTHAITVGPVRGDYASAYEFGTLALAVNERLRDSRRRAKIYQQFHAHVNFWRRPWHTCLPYAREACRSGLESGDFAYAAYGACTEAWPAFLCAPDLDQFVRDYTPNVALLGRLKNTGFADSLKIMLNWARALQGQTEAPLSLSDPTFDENAYLETYGGNPFFATFHAVAKLHLGYLLGEYREALQAAHAAREVVYRLAGTLWPPIFEFWNGLTLAASAVQATREVRRAYLDEMESARDAFAVLAQNCPENFLCQWLLLSAEFYRITGQQQVARQNYEEAICYAARMNSVHELALANELCARFHLELGQTRIGLMFMGEARTCYARWGAAAKVEELERRYAELVSVQALPPHRLPAPARATKAQAASGVDPAALDLLSLMKAAQAIAVEVDLERLLARLMRIAIENAGAQRGSLILEQDGEWLVKAEGAIDAAAVEVHDGIPLDAARGVPASIVHYVRRTSESLVLSSACNDDRFGSDPYVTDRKPGSVMCVPVLKQGRMTAILYLENNALGGAFAPERIQIIRLLSAEAAIAIENAKLFAELRREIQQRTQAQDRLHDALREAERLRSELQTENISLRRDLIVNVSHDLRTPLTSLRGYVEILLMKNESLSAAERRRYLEIAARQSERLATLVDELFELAKLDFAGLRLNFEPLQLSELAYDVLRKFRLAADAKGVGLDIEVHGEVPLVRADVGLIERVFDNLIANAIKYTPEQGQIKITVAAAGERVRVEVADTGCGIPEVHVPFVFDRFYRADESRNVESGGAGLGLAIVKRILQLHDGEIAVESEVMAGSRFSFSLPVRGRGDVLAA